MSNSSHLFTTDYSRFSESKADKENHLTQSTTLQEFLFEAEDENQHNSLSSIIKECKILVDEDIEIQQDDLLINFRRHQVENDIHYFFITFFNPTTILTKTPIEKNASELIERKSVDRVNEAELIVAIKKNIVFAGVLKAYWNSLPNYLTLFLKSLNINRPCVATPNTSILKKIQDEGGVKSVNFALNMSYVDLKHSIQKKSFLHKLPKSSKNKTIYGHLKLDKSNNPGIEDISNFSESDLIELLDTDNYLVTEKNSKIYPKKFLIRTTYFGLPFGDKSIHPDTAFAILKRHVTQYNTK